jgi:hypothetical protein
MSIEETYTLAFQVRARTKDGKEVTLGRRYHSKSAAETLADLMRKQNIYPEIWVSDVVGKDGIT